MMKDELFEAQLLRALGYAPYGGADVGECLATAERITRVDPVQWYEEWLATAGRLFVQAEGYAAAGERTSARDAYFRASNYFRTAGLFLYGAPIDLRLVESHRREVEAFRRGSELLELPPTIVAIPSEDGPLPGYFFRAAADELPRPTMILTGGYDGTVEELFFTSGAAALARGYNVLAFDGPGQGSMIIDRGVPIRPDWENVVRPVVDFALELPTVDPKRLVLMGLSFGGYLAPRAATKEHRLAACVSDCGPYDLFDASASRLPGFLARQLPDGNPWAIALLRRILRSVMRKPTTGWALRRNLFVHGLSVDGLGMDGLSDPIDFFRIASQYSLKGLEAQIACPTFVCSAEDDDLSSRASILADALVCEKEFVVFRAADGAGTHCESGARTFFHERVFAWLDTVLA